MLGLQGACSRVYGVYLGVYRGFRCSFFGFVKGLVSALSENLQSSKTLKPESSKPLKPRDLQSPLIKDCTLNLIRVPIII